VVGAIRPTALIGAAAVGGAFDEGVLRAVAAATNARPIILALSNPETAAECKAVDVDAFTGGRAVFAAGTAQADHASSLTGRPSSPGFANNALIFPGVALGAAVSGATSIGDAAWLAAARAVAACLTKDDVAAERVMPAVGRLVEVFLPYIRHKAADEEATASREARIGLASVSHWKLQNTSLNELSVEDERKLREYFPSLVHACRQELELDQDETAYDAFVAALAEETAKIALENKTAKAKALQERSANAKTNTRGDEEKEHEKKGEDMESTTGRAITTTNA
jgi:hypothetical protein